MTVIAALSDEQRRVLLNLARASVAHALGIGPAVRVSIGDPVVRAAGAAFVTLYVRGELRGCVGSVTWDDPLYEVVCRVAVGATEDRRFEPITAADLPDLRVEVSRLTPLQPASAEQIDVSRHGVALQHGGARALFLPKVAVEHGWDRTELLQQLCRKALLPDDAWQQSHAELYIFTAEVFGDI